MKRGIFWLIVTVVTFGLGVTSAFLWFEFRKSFTNETETINLPTEIPTVYYCEMLNNPDKYDGKIVRLIRISHILDFQYHGLVFNVDCYGENKQTAIIITHLRKDILDKLKVEANNPYSWGRRQITAIGKFSRQKMPRRSNLLANTLDFRFEIMEVEKAVKD
jgi:hypothetical protein